MNIQKEFKRTNKLYHFTAFDTALKIIETNRLRFGRLNNMNDIHENDKIVFVDADNQPFDKFPSDVLDALYDEIYKYRQISLTADNEADDKDGFNLHQMWGLYADKGEGICLVFDKKELEKSYDMVNIHHGRVGYDETKILKSFVISNSHNSEDVIAETKSQVSEIFFHKRKEWEHEQEYRMIKRCSNSIKEEYLLLGHALKFIIISSRLRNIDEVRYFKNIMILKEKTKKVEEARNIGEAGHIPILVYGNGLLDYALDTADGEKTIWDSINGYNTLTTTNMKTKYTKADILKLSSGELLEKLKGKAIEFHLTHNRLTELCVNDLLSYNEVTSSFHTITGIKIYLQDVDYIEVVGFE